MEIETYGDQRPLQPIKKKLVEFEKKKYILKNLNVKQIQKSDKRLYLHSSLCVHETTE